ncbi:hypothetical protein [Streptantibioticus silvisoli]|uniref:Leucine-binding protein domain-containing protein n=1 Tax=Streptantibioticus silvisoli TaxID=2705255 RepID=A0ABT6VWL0_9ACTN|nr:hypothetical protein [Streptantibioticus silvisoli]MDI5961656.1 hypothetical protein [Streptantibioticus silvisoli]
MFLKNMKNVEKESDVWSSSTIKGVGEVLSQIEAAFTQDTRTKNPKLKFTRFKLVHWLMTVDHPEISGARRERKVLAEIRKYNVTQSPTLTAVANFFRNGADEKTKDILSGWANGSKAVESIPLKALLLLGQIVVFLLFWARTQGRSKFLSQKYWWFMHQPHLAPELSGKFSHFALRLTKEELGNEAPEYATRLLVNAFLEDLRAAYKIRPLECGKPRRRTYPVVLLDNITSTNGGFRLLELINVVRNQTGQFDPLLMITAGTEIPPHGTPDAKNRTKYPPSNSLHAYEVWQGQLLRDRRARRDTAWYLPLTLPESGDRTRWPSIRKMDELSARRRTLRPGRWMSRVTHTGLIVLLVGGVTAVPACHHRRYLQEHCQTREPDLVRLRSSVASRWTCVGVTTSGHNLFDPSDPDTTSVENTVEKQNQRAVQLHRDFPDRPYITLIPLWALTSADHTSASLTADRESLEGLAVAQQQQEGKSADSDPIVRILLANAGPDMSDGVRAAQKIADEERRDKSVAAVVGLDMSSSNTERTIKELTHSGIPMIASTLSADDLTSLSKLYFQVSPRNIREAALVANFVKSLLPSAGETNNRANASTSSAADTAKDRTGSAASGKTKGENKGGPAGPAGYKVKIFYSNDRADTYSKNLADDAEAQFRDLKFGKTSKIAYTPSGGKGLDFSAREAGMSTCGDTKEYVFFAGRGDPDFRSFMDGARQCNSKVVVVGGDDVSRFVAADGKDLGYPAYYYVSFASISTGSGGKSPGRQSASTAADRYANTLQGLFPFEHPNPGSSDGHAALSYDAAQVAITAASYLASGATLPVSAGTEWREITAIGQPGKDSEDRSYLGISGRINYSDGNLQYPEDKEVEIRRVADDGGVNTQVAICGDPQSSASWCAKLPH